MTPLGHIPTAQDAVVRRFNGACRWVALAWLAIILPASLLIRPTYQDLSGIYIGGLVARLGAWDALYPVPAPGTHNYYIGEQGQSEQKPALLQIAADHGVYELNPYLNPPWQAVVLMPLGWLTFQQAHWVLVAINIFCTWRIAVAAGRGYELSAGRSSYAAGGITLLVACSMLAYRSIRVQNLSSLIAFCIAVTVSDLMGRSEKSGFIGGGFIGGLMMALGALIKLATLALIPLAVAMRRWRTLGWMLGLSVLAVLVTWNLAGTATFREFFSSIAPSLARSSTNPGNKSLQGFLIRATGQSPLPRSLNIAFEVLRWGTLGLILWLLFRDRPGVSRKESPAAPPRDGFKGGADLRKPSSTPSRGGAAGLPRALPNPNVFAAAVALVSWLLIFSPLCWEHYFIYLCPFWGWLLWEGTRSRARLIIVSLAIATHWFPLPTLKWLTLREPLNSYMLAGLFIMLTIALVRLRAFNAEELNHREHREHRDGLA